MPITRADTAQTFTLEAGVRVTVFTSRETGASALNAGTATFDPGVELACHIHDCEESITILEGEAVLDVEGQRHKLARYDTSVVGAGVPHRFRNASQTQSMMMFWVYASASAARTLVDSKRCEEHADEGPHSRGRDAA